MKKTIAVVFAALSVCHINIHSMGPTKRTRWLSIKVNLEDGTIVHDLRPRRPPPPPDEEHLARMRLLAEQVAFFAQVNNANHRVTNPPEPCQHPLRLPSDAGHSRMGRPRMGPNLRAIKINVDGSPPIVFELDEKHKIKMPEPHQSPDHHLFGQIRAAAGVGDPGPVAGPIVPQTELHDPAIEPPIPEEGTNPEPGFVDNR